MNPIFPESACRSHDRAIEPKAFERLAIPLPVPSSSTEATPTPENHPAEASNFF